MPLILSAQVNYPYDTLNTRLGNDKFVTQRPALSINGFDPGILGATKGRGLRQIIESVYNGDHNEVTLVNQLHNLSKDIINIDPQSRSDVNENTVKIQAKAFMALFWLANPSFSLCVLLRRT